MHLLFFIVIPFVIFLFTLNHKCVIVNSLYTGKYQSKQWKISAKTKDQHILKSNTQVKFIVALSLRNLEEMHSLFLEVSNPQSSSYGKYLSLQEIHNRFSPKKGDALKVLEFFQSIPAAIVTMNEFGDMIQVEMKQSDVEKLLHTELKWFTYIHDSVTSQRSLRTIKPLDIPLELHSLISFISLNSPINHIRSRSSKRLDTNYYQQFEKETNHSISTQSKKLTIASGNEEALIFFQPICGRASNSTINNENPPCNNVLSGDKPTNYKFIIRKHTTSVVDPHLLDHDPIIKTISYTSIYCFDANTTKTCNILTTIPIHCKCIAKLSNLPKYTQLQVRVYALYGNTATAATVVSEQELGVSNFLALTDVATPSFLSKLYNIPPGLSVKHGSNQSVAEFYGEFFSNKDLATFLQLSGLPFASIPDKNILGDLNNNPTKPGGEAQLDIEYIMALAPGADTYFYSFSDLNPFDASNEGFLSYVLHVNGDPHPPLVHSLSYGDVESEVFFDDASSEYGRRCDQEFMKMGLRGLTVVFSSGDDGIADFLIRDDPIGACKQANPSWPAGSPYITSIGATQLTDKYHPACANQYKVSSKFPELPFADKLNFQCTGVGETVCSSILGGIITSGGGFSNVYDREVSAPWQINAVNSYLSPENADIYPPSSYFNVQGRGYPDVSTYGSNYFVYLNSSIIRESGTSASAPVFAAMVTLWNDIRLSYKMPPLGFIAPFLYDIYNKTPQAFQDIVTGDNACGVGRSMDTVSCCNYSFAAIPGWDAVTGLGTPNFEIISNLVINQATFFPHLGSAVQQQPQISHHNTESEAGDTSKKTRRESLIALIFSLIAIVAASSSLVIVWIRATRGYLKSEDATHTASSIVTEEEEEVTFNSPTRSSRDRMIDDDLWTFTNINNNSANTSNRYYTQVNTN